MKQDMMQDSMQYAREWVREARGREKRAREALNESLPDYHTRPHAARWYQQSQQEWLKAVINLLIALK